MRVLLKLKQETISTRTGSETRRELRVYKNTFKIFSIDVFIFWQSLRLFPYFRVLSNFKTLALILIVLRELYRSFEKFLYWSSVSLWSIRVKKEWNYPSIESSGLDQDLRLHLQLKRHLKGMFGNPIAIVFGIFLDHACSRKGRPLFYWRRSPWHVSKNDFLKHRQPKCTERNEYYQR